jgi:hypothetical protein
VVVRPVVAGVLVVVGTMIARALFGTGMFMAVCVAVNVRMGMRTAPRMLMLVRVLMNVLVLVYAGHLRFLAVADALPGGFGVDLSVYRRGPSCAADPETPLDSGHRRHERGHVLAEHAEVAVAGFPGWRQGIQVI